MNLKGSIALGIDPFDDETGSGLKVLIETGAVTKKKPIP
jgi:hypothetical protein